MAEATPVAEPVAPVFEEMFDADHALDARRAGVSAWRETLDEEAD